MFAQSVLRQPPIMQAPLSLKMGPATRRAAQRVQRFGCNGRAGEPDASAQHRSAKSCRRSARRGVAAQRGDVEEQALPQRGRLPHRVVPLGAPHVLVPWWQTVPAIPRQAAGRDERRARFNDIPAVTRTRALLALASAGAIRTDWLHSETSLRATDECFTSAAEAAAVRECEYGALRRRCETMTTGARP